MDIVKKPSKSASMRHGHILNFTVVMFQTVSLYLHFRLWFSPIPCYQLEINVFVDCRVHNDSRKPRHKKLPPTLWVIS